VKWRPPAAIISRRSRGAGTVTGPLSLGIRNISGRGLASFRKHDADPGKPSHVEYCRAGAGNWNAMRPLADLDLGL
jgi:hypothetical protein